MARLIFILLGAFLCSLCEGQQVRQPDPNDPNYIAHMCRNCDMNHGVGYARAPGTCNSFIMCNYRDETPSAFNIHKCGGGLYWNQDLFTCDWPENVDCVATNTCPNQRANPQDPSTYYINFGGNFELRQCPIGFHYNEETCDCSTRIDPRPTDWKPVGCPPGYSASARDNFGYAQLVGDTWMYMPCPTTLIFDPNSCTCTYDLTRTTTTPGVEPAGCNVHLQILFDGDVRDSSRNGFWINDTNVEVNNGFGVFNGSSKLIIPALSNVQFQDLHIRIRYQQQNGNTMQTLVANGDCQVTPAISICADNSNVRAELQVDGVSQPRNLGLRQNTFNNQWQELSFTVTPGQVDMTLGNDRDSSPIDGPIRRVHRGLVIGGGGACDNFIGMIDSVEVYKCVP